MFIACNTEARIKPAAYRMSQYLAIALLSLASTRLMAADFASGLDAFDRGLYQEALAQFKPLAQEGNARAEYRLGLSYAKGLGIARDYKRAVIWLRKSADQGYASAENDLGTLYDQGRGVAASPEQAARWFHMAAVQGHGSAQLNLATLYLKGRGVRQDPVQAFAWANAASDLGEFRAEGLVRQAGKSLDPEQIVQAEKLTSQYRQKYVRPFRKY